jgi:N-acetylneuraminic acid mutarotase
MKKLSTVIILGLLIFSMFPTFASRVMAETGSWTTKTPLPHAQALFGTAVVNGKIYAIGGHYFDGASYVWLDTNYEYSPDTDSWTSEAPMPTERTTLAVASLDNKIYAIGGAASTVGGAFSTNEEFNPLTNSWTTKAPMPTPRNWISAAAANGKIYVMGGSDNYGSIFSTNEMYDPLTDTWTSKTQLPQARLACGIGVVNGKIYLIGGWVRPGSPPGEPTTLNEEYDPQTGTWTTRAPMPTARNGLAVAVVNNKIYAFGGATDFNPWTNNLNVVEEYDPSTDNWSTIQQMPTSRSLLGAAAVGDKIYAIGGLGTVYLDTNEEFSIGAPVGYWRFDEGAGHIAHDSSGNGNGGSVNDASWTNGVLGQALQFDGIDDWVSIPTSQTLEITGNQITFEFWVKFDNAISGSSPYMKFYDKGNAYNSAMRETGNVRFTFWVAGDSSANLDSSRTSWLAGPWYHIAEVYDGNVMSIYVNGALDNSMPMTGNIASTTYPIALGAYTLGSQWFLQGAMDELEIYNCARTAEEILNDYSSVARLKVLAWGWFDGGIDVQYHLPDGTTFTYRGWLQSKGYSVSTDSEVFPNGVVTLAQLQDFQAIILDDWFLANPASSVYVSLIVDYVSQGGGLIILGEYGDPQMTLDEALGFHWIENPWSFAVDAAPTDTTHPVMQGITEMPKSGGMFVDWDALIAESPLPSNTAILARTTGSGGYYDPSNIIALIAFEFGNGRVISGPGSGLMRPYAATSVNGMDVIGNPITENKLLINALSWVTAQAQPDFKISASPKIDDVADPHSPTEFVVTVKSLNGFNLPVTLSAVYSSHELSGSFGDMVVTPPSDGSITTTLTVSVLSEALNTHQIYVTGTSGTLSHTNSTSLHVPFMSVPYLSQGDASWCVPTSLAMAMDFWGKNIKPWEVAEYFGLGHDDGFKTPDWIQKVEYYVEAQGLACITEYNLNEARLKSLLGYSPVWLETNWTSNGQDQLHAVVVTGFNNDEFFINDPSGALLEEIFPLNPPITHMQVEVMWTELSHFINFQRDPEAIAIAGTGTITLKTGLLNLVGGKISCFRTIRSDHEGVDGPYIWESGGNLSTIQPLEKQGITWQYGSHQRSLDPFDKFLICRPWMDQNDYLIVNPTSAQMDYDFYVSFVGSSWFYSKECSLSVAPCTTANPSFDTIDLGSCLGSHFGEYTITLELYDSKNSLLDKIELPPIKYKPFAQISARSPVNLFVTDTLGRSIGINPTNGKLINEIPDAFYSGPNTEPQVIMIPDPVNGTYSIVLVGTATGNYTLTIEYISATQTLTQSFKGTISPQETKYYSAILSETGQMTAISWEYVFKDARQGTMLKISTDDKYFQFTAPGKDFGVKHDPGMRILCRAGMIIICYRDSQMCLTATASVDWIEFCVANAWDRQTGKCYWLIERPHMRGRLDSFFC